MASMVSRRRARSLSVPMRLRDADVIDRGQVHDVAAGQRDVAGAPGALGADGLLGDLDDDLLAFADDLADGGGLREATGGHSAGARTSIAPAAGPSVAPPVAPTPRGFGFASAAVASTPAPATTPAVPPAPASTPSPASATAFSAIVQPGSRNAWCGGAGIADGEAGQVRVVEEIVDGGRGRRRLADRIFDQVEGGFVLGQRGGGHLAARAFLHRARALVGLAVVVALVLEGTFGRSLRYDRVLVLDLDLVCVLGFHRGLGLGVDVDLVTFALVRRVVGDSDGELGVGGRSGFERRTRRQGSRGCGFALDRLALGRGLLAALRGPTGAESVLPASGQVGLEVVGPDQVLDMEERRALLARCR